jgi:hypothetical protein
MTPGFAPRDCFVVVLLLLSSCGYHVGGKADLLPKTIHTIAIPPFATTSSSYKLVDSMPRAIGNEFLTRTRFRIVNEESRADAVLSGNILSARAYPNVSDPNTGRSISLRVVVVLSVKLVDSHTGQVLFSRSDFTFRQDYEAAVQPHELFDESGPAFDRVNRDAARDIVSAIVEKF